MTTITAKVVAATKHPHGGKPIYTLQLRYPLIIHAELLTHRVFSRNSSSNRAVPTAKIIEEVVVNPFIPIEWGLNRPGMVALEVALDEHHCEQTWLNARDEAVATAHKLVELGLHKQIVNRVLMPFQHIDTLVTATEWDNFFKLRLQADVEPHMKKLAFEIGVAIDEVVFTEGSSRHIPFVDKGDFLDHYYSAEKELISAARCARVTTRSAKADVSRDIELAHTLKNEKHMSPFEHQAIPGKADEMYFNLQGWKSLRYRLEDY
jgi:thymidylate synthase ThyX